MNVGLPAYYHWHHTQALIPLFFSDYLFKLLLIGDSGVGKSCLLLRFAVSSPVSDTSNRVLWHQSEALLLSISAGRHLHWELHQHHRSGFQDPHHRARREDHQTADCKCACKHSFNQCNCSNWAALPRHCLTFDRDTWSKNWSDDVHTYMRWKCSFGSCLKFHGQSSNF